MGDDEDDPYSYESLTEQRRPRITTYGNNGNSNSVKFMWGIILALVVQSIGQWYTIIGWFGEKFIKQGEDIAAMRAELALVVDGKIIIMRAPSANRLTEP